MTEEKKILLVDEPNARRETLAAEIGGGGYTVALAGDGGSAIEQLQADQFDVVITELRLPETDGFQVLKRAKILETKPSVIILTDHQSIAAVVDALRLGADDYLLKPCLADDLLFRIARCLAKQEQQKLLNMYERILSICAVCKKIRDDKGVARGTGKWVELENYLIKQSNVQVSHGYCPACFEKAISQLG